MEQKRIILPGKEEMLERLIKVNDTAHLIERFYPILLKEAGNGIVASGVVMMLMVAIHDYTKGMPAVMTIPMLMNMDGFIDALILDPEVAAEAKAFSKSMQEVA